MDTSASSRSHFPLHTTFDKVIVLMIDHHEDTATAAHRLEFFPFLRAFFFFSWQERRAVLLKEREEARARGEAPESAIDTARAKAIKQKEAAAAAASAAGLRFSIDEDEASQVRHHVPSSLGPFSTSGLGQPTLDTVSAALLLLCHPALSIAAGGTARLAPPPKSRRLRPSFLPQHPFRVLSGSFVPYR